MPDTYSQLYVHIIFAVKNREAFIQATWKDEIYKYITGIVQNKGNKMLAINGTSNHIHLFVGIKPNCSISDLVREIKKSSTHFIQEKKFTSFKFQWQEGYGAFTYGHSQISNVIEYINNQEQHHKKKTFKDEYIAFLNAFNITFKDEYLFDWKDK